MPAAPPAPRPCRLQVCGTTPCRLNGAQNVTEALTEYLGIGMGQTTADGTFTLGEMECMGACVNAPMIVVSDYSNGVEGYSYIYYEDLTPDDAVAVAKAYAAGAPHALPPPFGWLRFWVNAIRCVTPWYISLPLPCNGPSSCASFEYERYLMQPIMHCGIAGLCSLRQMHCVAAGPLPQWGTSTHEAVLVL